MSGSPSITRQCGEWIIPRASLNAKFVKSVCTYRIMEVGPTYVHVSHPPLLTTLARTYYPLSCPKSSTLHPLSSLCSLSPPYTLHTDFDALSAYGTMMVVGDVGLWLERVLHTPNSTNGDSPKIAGCMVETYPLP